MYRLGDALQNKKPIVSMYEIFGVLESTLPCLSDETDRCTELAWFRPTERGREYSVTLPSAHSVNCEP